MILFYLVKFVDHPKVLISTINQIVTNLQEFFFSEIGFIVSKFKEVAKIIKN